LDYLLNHLIKTLHGYEKGACEQFAYVLLLVTDQQHHGYYYSKNHENNSFNNI